jgi:hypothetical protein
MTARTVAAVEGRQTVFFTQSVSAPVNDNFTAAIAFSLPQPGALPGNNVSATTEPGEPNHANIPAHGSIWWKTTAPSGGTLTLSTKGSSIDTILAVYTGDSVAALTPVASNDDHYPDIWSQVTFTAVQGTTYQIAVGGFAGTSGPIRLLSTWDVVSPPSTSPPPPSTPPPSTPPPSTPPISRPPANEFVPLDPSRLADTRDTGMVAAGTTLQVQVTERSGVPVDAAAVVLDVFVTEPSGPGFITVFPCGEPRPNGSSLNYVAGSTVANTVVAKVGVGGKVCLFTLAKSHIGVDVSGFFPPSGSLVSMVPARLMDTRPGLSTIDGESAGLGVLSGGSVTRLRTTGRDGVPTSAGAVVLNVTVTEAVAPGFVTIYPCGSPRPNSSSLNYATGSTVANAVIIKVGTAGEICLFTSSATHLIADINGYFAEGSSFTPLVPARLLETRDGLTTIDGLYNAIGKGWTDSLFALSVGGRAGVPNNATAVVLNVTVTETDGSGFITVFPCELDRPLSSNVNFVAGATTPNAVVAKLGVGGRVCLYMSSGTHLIVDINGYFAGGA